MRVERSTGSVSTSVIPLQVSNNRLIGSMGKAAAPKGKGGTEPVKQSYLEPPGATESHRKQHRVIQNYIKPHGVTHTQRERRRESTIWMRKQTD